MSIRSFHIIFVTLSTLLCLFLAWWAFLWPGQEGGKLVTSLGLVGIIGFIGLPVYGVYFYRKVRKM
jgi:DNA-binding transcriptional regulator of glucitol operon